MPPLTLDQELELARISRPTSVTHCPLCLEAWWALGIADPCAHDRPQLPPSTPHPYTVAGAGTRPRRVTLT